MSEINAKSALAGLIFYYEEIQKMKQLFTTSKLVLALATGAALSFAAPAIVNAQTPAPAAAPAKAAPAPAAPAKVDAPKAEKAPAKTEAAPADKPKKAKKKAKKAKKDAAPAK